MEKANFKVWAGIAAVGVAVLWFLTRAGAGNDQSQVTYNVQVPNGNLQTTSDTPPAYMTYNFPKLPDINITIPTTQNYGGASNTGATCGCQGPSPDFYSSLSALLNNYETNIAAFSQNYIDNLKSAFPNFVSQYFNAQSGAQLSRTASAQLGSAI
jgi:hypothetical protein